MHRSELTAGEREQFDAAMSVLSRMGGDDAWGLLEHAVAAAIAHHVRHDTDDLTDWAESLLATLSMHRSEAFRHAMSSAKPPALDETVSVSGLLARLPK